MQELRIKKLTIENFKGIKSLTIEPEGDNLSVFGKNATGKTTIVDAWMYLLFGKDSQGKADFMIKPVTDAGEEIHNLETVVAATLDYNSNPLTLKKRYQEKWTKSRGKAQAEFSGHTTDYFIDDVPAKKKDFDAKINEIIDADVFKLVSSPYGFSSLHWQERRKILLELAGVDAGEIVDVENEKKKIAAHKKEINKELEQIPVRISELQNSISEAKEPDRELKKILDKSLEEAEEKLRSIRSNEELSKKQVRVNEIDAEIAKAKAETTAKQAESQKPLLGELNRLNQERAKLDSDIFQLSYQIKADKELNARAVETQNHLREQWYFENKKPAPKPEGCPYCGQPLPEDKVQEIIEGFNQEKAEALAKINKEGSELKVEIEEREAAIQANKEKLEANNERINKLSTAVEETQAILNGGSDANPPASDELEKEKAVLLSEISALKNGSAIQEQDAQNAINEIKSKIPGSMKPWKSNFLTLRRKFGSWWEALKNQSIPNSKLQNSKCSRSKSTGA